MGADGGGVVMVADLPIHTWRHARKALMAVAVSTGLVAFVASRSSGRDVQASMRRLEISPNGRSLANASYQLPDCPDPSRWDQVPWSYLSSVEQSSWLTLGWLPATWDLAHPMPSTTTYVPLERRQLASNASASYRPPADSMCFQNLDPPGGGDRQDAVKTLGYTIATWHACQNRSCPWPADVPTPDDPCLDQMLYLKQLYSGKSWPQLTFSTQQALINLGWDEYGKMWTISQKPSVYSKPWSDLMPREREAATFLGYTQSTWEGCEMETSCIVRIEILENELAKYIWGQMPLGIQTLLVDLGWDERSWGEGEEPAPMRLVWADLSYEQKRAALLLGYAKDTWSGCPGAPCLERFDWLGRKYNRIRWIDMKLAVQRAWLLLENSPEMWAVKGVPPTMQERWEELSSEQQRMASFLGYDAGTWQGCNLNWTMPSSFGGGNLSQISNSPTRAVRARMYIDRPFSDISGNIYGAQVSTLPTAFVDVFEQAVARALFCGNPPLSVDQQTFVDATGAPLCIMKSNYDMQSKRVKVISVLEGSIIVDFYIFANATKSQPTSPQLLAMLQTMVVDPKSPIAMDVEFGRFASRADVTEMPYSDLTTAQMASALQFETLRAAYSNANGCRLGQDFREVGSSPCPTSLGHRRRAGLFVAALLLVASRAGCVA